MDSNVGGGITWLVQPVGAVLMYSIAKAADEASSARGDSSQGLGIGFRIES